jgi:hypothetical protein
MAMELSHRQWRLGFTDRWHKIRGVTIEARNRVAVQDQIGQAKGVSVCRPMRRCSAGTKPVETDSRCITT